MASIIQAPGALASTVTLGVPLQVVTKSHLNAIANFWYYDSHGINIRVTDLLMIYILPSPQSWPRDTWLGLTLFGRANVGWANDPRANVIAPNFLSTVPAF